MRQSFIRHNFKLMIGDSKSPKLILAGILFGISIVAIDTGSASAQYMRENRYGRDTYSRDTYQRSPYPRVPRGEFYGGGFGVPYAVPAPAPRYYYEPGDDEVVYTRRRPRYQPPQDIDADDEPVRHVRRPKYKLRRETADVVAPKRAHKKPAKMDLRPSPSTPSVPPVITAVPSPRPVISPGAPPVTETRYVPNEVVFEFKPMATPQSIDQIIAGNKLERISSWKFKLTDSIIYRYKITDGRPVSTVIAALEQNSDVRFAQPNYIYSLQQKAPAQPNFSPPNASLPSIVKISGASLPPQYVADIMKLSDAHKLAKGANIIVSVIDSAIDTMHPELSGSVTDSLDQIGGTAKPDAHGTAMTGAVAAHGQLTGIAPDVKILAVRAFGGKDAPVDAAKSGIEGTSFQILRGLDWSYEKQARIVNMSFAGPKDPALSRMIAAAKDKRMVVIAAAGNAGVTSAPLYPAADPNVIAVTATDPESRLYPQSNRGTYITVAAPGVDVLVAAPDGAYDFSTGTSVATAHVSGLAALILQRQPNLDADGVRKALTTTATGIKSTDKLEAKLVDALAAVKSVGTK